MNELIENAAWTELPRAQRVVAMSQARSTAGLKDVAAVKARAVDLVHVHNLTHGAPIKMIDLNRIFNRVCGTLGTTPTTVVNELLNEGRLTGEHLGNGLRLASTKYWDAVSAHVDWTTWVRGDY